VGRRESAETLMFVRTRERNWIECRCGIRYSKASEGMNGFVMVRFVSGNVHVVERWLTSDEKASAKDGDAQFDKSST